MSGRVTPGKMSGSEDLFRRLARRQPAEGAYRVESQVALSVEALIAEVDLEAFLLAALPSRGAELNDILQRAVFFTISSRDQGAEVSFLSLSAALESILTFFRRQDKYKILAAGDFNKLEIDLKKWLKQQPALASESAKRALIYEKLPELNRFPFSFIFRKFCEHHSLDLSDLWPVTGKHAEWPLMEVRHRLVHGDPFVSRPIEALACAEAHLRWTVERMLLCVMGWPIERSTVAADTLRRTSSYHASWQEERARFA